MRESVSAFFDAAPRKENVPPFSDGNVVTLLAPVRERASFGEVAGRVAKRLFDIVGAIALIMCALVPMLITALLVKLTSRGPVLFSRLDDGSPARRVGRDGMPFAHYKFRTMHVGTHMQRYRELAARNERADGPLVKIKDDPRLTPIGKWLRKLSVDELPEFFLVLRGDMSLVGPRPHLPEEVQKYKTWQLESLRMKPGITGLAQVSGRADLDFDTESNLNVAYVRHWSLWLDIKILLKTPLVVITGRGAY